MCTGPNQKACTVMEGEEFHKPENTPHNISFLLELSASDDLSRFKSAIEEEGYDVNESGLWYGRRIGSRYMGYEERTPLLIASMFGSKQVLTYIINKQVVNVNQAYGSDKATALHCAVTGSSPSSHEIVKLLLDASADPNLTDSNNNRPGDLISKHGSYIKSTKNILEFMLNEGNTFEEACVLVNQVVTEKKEYPIDPSLPDIKTGIYGTDEFRMFTFKVKPCSRAYSHDWTECPFVHPGENARRRDPRKYHYSCVPCPEYKKGTCQQGDTCEYAHGIFESWLHPAQYRTRMCKDEETCNRRVCFFAHKVDELRPLYASTGSGMPSPRSSFSGGGLFDMPLGSPVSSPIGGGGGGGSPVGGLSWPHQNGGPPTLQLPGSRLRSASNARDWQNMSRISSPNWNNNVVEQNGHMNIKPTNLEGIFGSFDQSRFDELRGSYSLSSSPVSYGVELASRSAAFAKRSQSFIERNEFYPSSPLSDWGSPSGKLEWGPQGDELNKLRKSSSFGYRAPEPDVSWVGSLVKEAPPVTNHGYGGGSEMVLPQWVDQLYPDHEKIIG